MSVGAPSETAFSNGDTEAKEEVVLDLQRAQWIILSLLLIVGLALRVISFGEVPPSGLYQDEAFAGYEAFSLVTYGIDSDGYPNPVYFLAWGNGMNVLESYLAIPFIKLLGCTAVAIRLPQLIMGLVTIPFFYLLVRKVFSIPTALVATALLVVCPWHVMMCRFALESNMAPSFYIMGLFFLVKGTEDARFWLLSAAFFGIDLYTYAITWSVVPLTLLSSVIYLAIKRRALGGGFRWKWVGSSVLILFVLALPLILFLLVNRGLMPEIVTPFISIPKLTLMRMGEFSLGTALDPQSWLLGLSMFLGLPDRTSHNAIPIFGAFYYVSIPFIIGGLIALVRLVVKDRRDDQVDLRVMVLLGFVATFITCLMTEYMNLQRSNCMHAFSVIFAAVGIVEACRWLAAKRMGLGRAVASVLCVLYLGSAGWFCAYYFTIYDEVPEVQSAFNAGLDDAMGWIRENLPSNTRVATHLQYSNILYWAEVPTPEFIGTVTWMDNQEDGYRYPARFGRFLFGFPEEDDPAQDCIYLYRKVPQWMDFFQSNGFQVLEFENCFVAFYPEG